MLDVNSKTFMVQVDIQKQEEIAMDPVRKAQIKVQSKAHVRALIFDKTLTKVLQKYSN